MTDKTEIEQNKKGISFVKLVKTTLAAAIGVQTDKNRREDFESGSIFPYIAAGIIFTALFILTIILVVNLILNQSS